VQDAKQHGSRWPRGPFPLKYAWAAVEARLAAEPPIAESLAGLGLALGEGHDDEPYYAVAAGPGAVDLPALRARVAGRRISVFRWAPDPERVVLVASPDPMDAVVAVGVAGPHQGVGNRAVVRFLVHLRAFARIDLDTLGEAALSLSCVPEGPEAAERIAERALQLCPALASVGVGGLASALSTSGRLDLAWPA